MVFGDRPWRGEKREKRGERICADLLADGCCVYVCMCARWRGLSSDLRMSYYASARALSLILFLQLLSFCLVSILNFIVLRIVNVASIAGVVMYKVTVKLGT